MRQRRSKSQSAVFGAELAEVLAKRTQAPKSWRVERYTDVKHIASYGPFPDRETAERVAQRSIEKHVGDTVVVIPPPTT